MVQMTIQKLDRIAKWKRQHCRYTRTKEHNAKMDTQQHRTEGGNEHSVTGNDG